MDIILNSAQEVLGKAKVSVLDSARFVRNILDAKPSDSKLTDAQFVLKVIEAGLRNIRAKEMSLADGFALYLKSKQHLRPDSIRDIRCIGNRLLRTKPELGERNFSELSVSECEEWLNGVVFDDPQVMNRVEIILHPERFPEKDPGRAALRAVEDAVEQNDNSFDGIINNLPEPDPTLQACKCADEEAKQSVLAKLKEQQLHEPQHRSECSYILCGPEERCRE